MSWTDRWKDRPARQAVEVWAGLLLLLVVAKVTVGLLPMGGSVVGALAVALFLWIPGTVQRRLGLSEEDYGLNRDNLGKDLLFAVTVMVVVFPPFVGLFRGFLWWLDEAAPAAWRVLTPYGVSHGFHWRAPDGLLDKVGGNIAIALGEEFFYRGYVQSLLERAYPPRFRLWGVPFGRAAFQQTLLFAAGHLLTPQPNRLMTFFPGLLFTWMAVRCGRVLPAAIVHAASNLLIATLEASAFGP